MHRRSVLAVVPATVLAGCGWGQETRSIGNTNRHESEDGTLGGDVTPEPLPESEAGETLIERPGEELLLPVSEFREWTDRDGWQEQRVQSTHACQELSLSVPDETRRECEYCNIVAEDDGSARDEYQTFADISETEKVLDNREERLQEQDVGLEVGNEAVVYLASLRTREEERGTGDLQEMTRTRVVFRDRNVVGTIEYTERTWVESDIQLQGPRELADLAVRQHEYWRKN